MLTVTFSESLAISRTQVKFWYNRFKEGRDDVKYEAQLPMKTLKQLKKINLDNRCSTLRAIITTCR